MGHFNTHEIVVEGNVIKGMIVLLYVIITNCQKLAEHTNMEITNSSMSLIANSETVNQTLMKVRKNDHCNSSDEKVECGTIEYMGCTGSKRLYHESAIKMSWFEGWEYCRNIGLHLVAIESRYEQAFIEIFLPPLGASKTESFWTSGTDLGKEGQFSWMATGRPFSYENWRYGEPNNRFGTENCVELVIKPEVIGYFWNDRNCFAKAYVVCQHDVRYPDKFTEVGESTKESIAGH